MNRIMVRHRQGMSLIEVIIFVALFGFTISILFPILFISTQNRYLQQTVAVVEQNGTQIANTVTFQLRHAEKILDPPLGRTGAVLALQTGSGATNPTIIGVESGTLIIIRKTTKERISSPQVAITNFVVRNTSINASRQSVYIRFSATRTIRLQMPHTYSREFTLGTNIFPDDVFVGNACVCAAPGCMTGGGRYQWRACENTQCATAESTMECP